MSLRRSSRARAAQSFASLFSAAGNQSGGGSSNGSGSSSRGERSTRNSGRTEIPEEDSDLDIDDDDEDDDDDDGKDDDDLAEEEETTRCVCGSQDYPGPPLLEPSGFSNGRQSKGRMASGSMGSSQTTADNTGDEPGSMFIQCDSCKVWQHGGCVGIMDEASTPDEYFCEDCRPDFHQLGKAPNGQLYSKYNPLQETPKSQSKNKRIPTTPAKASAAKSTRERERQTTKPSKPVAEPSRRRSTMNSRAVYDDDETLRRIIEESKSDIQPPHSERESRRGKRGRDESDEPTKTPSKRLRTQSEDAHSTSSQSPSASTEVDDTKSKKSQPVSSRSQRQKERERTRIESTRQRNSQDSPPPEIEMSDLQDPSDGNGKNDEVEPSGSDSKPADVPPPVSRQNEITKKGRQPRSRGSAARNQPANDDSTETKDVADADASEKSDVKDDRDEGNGNNTKDSGTDSTLVPNDVEEAGEASRRSGSSHRSGSQIQIVPLPPSQSGSGKTVPHTPIGPCDLKAGLRGSDALAAIANGAAVVGSGGGPGRRKGREKNGMGELKKKASFMLEYISRVQLELSQRSSSLGPTTEKSSGPGQAQGPGRRGGAGSVNQRNGKAGMGSSSSTTSSNESSLIAHDEDESGRDDDSGLSILSHDQLAAFTGLATTEMMDVLARKLVLWQQEFGKVNER